VTHWLQPSVSQPCHRALKNAIALTLRVTVFTGPVFTDSDPIFRGIALPKHYWKIVMIVKADGLLSCTGYLPDQGNLIG
jgi:endonuclease G, mitochondrial